MDQSMAVVPMQGDRCSLDITRWLPPGGVQQARGSDCEEDSKDGMVATGGRWRGLGRGAALQLPSWALSQPALDQPNPDLLCLHNNNCFLSQPAASTQVLEPAAAGEILGIATQGPWSPPATSGYVQSKAGCRWVRHRGLA